MRLQAVTGTITVTLVGIPWDNSGSKDRVIRVFVSVKFVYFDTNFVYNIHATLTGGQPPRAVLQGTETTHDPKP